MLLSRRLNRAPQEAREARALAVTSATTLVTERDRLAAALAAAEAAALAGEEERGRLEDHAAVLADKCHLLMGQVAALGGAYPVSPVASARPRDVPAPLSSWEMGMSVGAGVDPSLLLPDENGNVSI